MGAAANVAEHAGDRLAERRLGQEASRVEGSGPAPATALAVEPVEGVAVLDVLDDDEVRVGGGVDPADESEDVNERISARPSDPRIGNIGEGVEQ